MSTTVEANETSNSDETRLRLVTAMSAAIAEKGYGATTIADVVARARVSRRTFYEHFTDKEACLLVCHTMLGDRILVAMTTGFAVEAPLLDRITKSVHALIDLLTENPELTHTHYVAIQAAGQEARRARREVQTGLAGQLQKLAERARLDDPRVKVPSPYMATAIVGGIGELIVQAVDFDRIDRLDEIADTVIELISAVLISPS